MIVDWKSEQALIRQIQQTGCVDSSQRLFKQLRLYQQVHCFVQRYLSNHLDIEEVTQETLSRAFFNISRFDSERSRFRSWVFGIAMHQVYDCLRQRKYCSLSEGRDLPLLHRSPEEMTSLMQSEEALLEAVEGLKERYRRVLINYYVEGMSQQEIAETEGITANNVGTILNRARKYLATSYEARLRQRGRSKNKRRKLSKEGKSFAQMLPAMTQRFCHS